MRLISLALLPLVTKALETGQTVERQLPARDFVDELVAVEHVDAVIDAVDADLLQALPDMLGRVLLIDVAMHGEEIALLRGRARTPS